MPVEGALFVAAEAELLKAVIDRIIPADKDPGAIDLGTDRYVLAQLAGEASPHASAIRDGLQALVAAVPASSGAAFVDLSADARDDVLRTIESEAWFRALSELVAEGFFANPSNGGNRDALSWHMLGYEHRLPDGPDGPPPAKPHIRWRDVPDGEWDVIVVGAGAAGGVMAAVLAESGKRVLVLERGPYLDYATAGRRDHLRNQRLSQYGHNAGPEIHSNPRVLVDPDSHEMTLAPHESGYHNNAAAVGSGTVVFGAQAWRFLPEDFRMASLYGVPEESSLVDWPIGYDDLAPYYHRAEWEIGVAGHTTDRLPVDYPMPPTPQWRIADLLKAGAAELGFSTLVPPLLINTIDRSGRAACIECGSCIGFACPSNSKNGTQNTALPRAVATGNCEIGANAHVERIETDRNGRVTGVSYLVRGEKTVEKRTITAKQVVLCAGAIESARLLLSSRSDHHPDGLGNAHDQVGRNLQGHYYAAASAEFDDEIYDPHGPGVTIATRQFNHGNPGIVGGGMLADDFILLPIIFWKTSRPDDAPHWGQGAKDYMRHNYRRITGVKGPVHEIPVPTARVQLDDRVRDALGLQVPRLSGMAHIETVKATEFLNARASEWLTAAGARRTWTYQPVQRLSGGQHQAGTCRMGTDPANSVTDMFGRVWGHDNLFVSDASLHPTNGGFNPVLTIMAMAFRNAAHIASVG